MYDNNQNLFDPQFESAEQQSEPEDAYALDLYKVAQTWRRLSYHTTTPAVKQAADMSQVIFERYNGSLGKASQKGQDMKGQDMKGQDMKGQDMKGQYMIQQAGVAPPKNDRTWEEAVGSEPAKKLAPTPAEQVQIAERYNRTYPLSEKELLDEEKARQERLKNYGMV